MRLMLIEMLKLHKITEFQVGKVRSSPGVILVIMKSGVYIISVSLLDRRWISMNFTRCFGFLRSKVVYTDRWRIPIDGPVLSDSHMSSWRWVQASSINYKRDSGLINFNKKAIIKMIHQLDKDSDLLTKFQNYRHKTKQWNFFLPCHWSYSTNSNILPWNLWKFLFY